MKENHQSYDTFIGKISPFLLFEMEYHSLSYVVENLKNDKFYSEINPSSQVASIGILAYFEAFCKHQFAAIVNIMPSLVGPFCHKRSEPTIEISTVAAFKGDFQSKIGFVLAEIYDFGTSKSINSIFYDLLGIKPFNSKEIKVFTSILSRRNLLVHHGAIIHYSMLRRKTLRKLYNQRFSGILLELIPRTITKLQTSFLIWL